MSPEQIEGRELDSRSDIYSLGVTAYHMLAGQPPFTGDTPLAVAVQHLNSTPPPLTSRRPDVPPRLAQVVERMMAKKPADRFSDPAALLAELHAVATEGAQQGWAAKPDYTALSEMLQAADLRSAATTRLDELMKTTAMSSPKQTSWRWTTAALLASFLLGLTIAAMTRPRSLLAGAQSGPPIRKDVKRQLYHAKQVDTELAWKRVLENFPDPSNAFYHNLAREGLVYYYIRTKDFDNALAVLDELSAQREFQPFAIAGRVVVYTNRGDEEKAAEENQRLSADMRTSLAQQAPQMYDLLTKAIDELADRALEEAASRAL
jgi:serine/threonine-protein kinase